MIHQIHHFDFDQVSLSTHKTPPCSKFTFTLTTIPFIIIIINNNNNTLSLLDHPRFLPHIFFQSSTTSFPNASSNVSPTFPTNTNTISLFISFWTSRSTILMIWIPGSPMNRSIRFFVDDERSLHMAKDLLKGQKVGQVYASTGRFQVV